MIRFVIGGQSQGKLAYVLKNSGLCHDDVAFCENDDIYGVFNKKIIYGLHHLIKRLHEATLDPMTYISGEIKNKDLIIISNEVGCGVTPLDKDQRDLRDSIGKMSTYIADVSCVVERVYCGVGAIIKDSVDLSLIRHGETLANIEKRYLGKTDQSLSDNGVLMLKEYISKNIYDDYDLIYSSPKARCLETAALIYPKIKPIINSGLMECNFGDFENMTYNEIKAMPEHKNWGIEGTWYFPGGDDAQTFYERCHTSFTDILIDVKNSKSRSAAVLSHGGVIMAIMEKYVIPKKDYYDWQVDNACGFLIRYDFCTQNAVLIRRIKP